MQSEDVSGVGAIVRRGDGATEKIRVGGTDLRFRRRELEVVFLQLFEQSRNGEDVSGEIRIEDINVIEVGGHAVKAFDDFVDHPDEPSRRRAAPLRHDQLLEEARGRTECRVRDRVFVNQHPVKGRGEIKERTYPSSPQLVEDFVDTGYGKLTENADVVKPFAVDSKPNLAGFVQYDNRRAPIRRRGVLYEASREILVQNHVNLFGHGRIPAIGARGHRGAVG